MKNKVHRAIEHDEKRDESHDRMIECHSTEARGSVSSGKPAA